LTRLGCDGALPQRLALETQRLGSIQELQVPVEV
jgi:hypothetical protein